MRRLHHLIVQAQDRDLVRMNPTLGAAPTMNEVEVSARDTKAPKRGMPSERAALLCRQQMIGIRLFDALPTMLVQRAQVA